VLLKVKTAKPAKTKAPKTVVQSKTKISSTNVAKTLATPKQGEYGQLKKNKKPLDKPKHVDKKQQQKQLVRSKPKPYSNKIRKWVWPSTGNIIAKFSNKENGNKGIDIAGSIGSSIVSAADGKVVYYGNALRGYGNLIIIKHNDDYLSAYAHNRKVLVKEKDFVKAGQKIAEMGNSDSDRVKLHFEVRYRGKSVNPLKYLPKR
jgi:lipoprotein NlpD